MPGRPRHGLHVVHGGPVAEAVSASRPDRDRAVDEAGMAPIREAAECMGLRAGTVRLAPVSTMVDGYLRDARPEAGPDDLLL